MSSDSPETAAIDNGKYNLHIKLAITRDKVFTKM